jgi:hypothetical protein
VVSLNICHLVQLIELTLFFSRNHWLRGLLDICESDIRLDQGRLDLNDFLYHFPVVAVIPAICSAVDRQALGKLMMLLVNRLVLRNADQIFVVAMAHDESTCQCCDQRCIEHRTRHVSYQSS